MILGLSLVQVVQLPVDVAGQTMERQRDEVGIGFRQIARQRKRLQSVLCFAVLQLQLGKPNLPD